MTLINRTRLLGIAKPLRDAKLYLIGVEGKVTEPLYFNDLQQRRVFHERVCVTVLPPIGGESSPRGVLERVGLVRESITDWKLFDEVWLVVDRDRSKDQHINEVASKCEQKDYHLAMTNPCFELWLFLHHADLTDPITSVEHAEAALKSVDKDFSPKSKRFNVTQLAREHVINAIDRARKLDTQPKDRWPQNTGSRVYLLAEKLLRIGQ